LWAVCVIMGNNKRLILGLFGLILMLFCSCVQRQDLVAQKFKVLVVHSYSSCNNDYRKNVALLQSEFDRQGLAVDMTHLCGEFWACLPEDAFRDHVEDYLKHDNEKPDVTIVLDDPMFEVLTSDSTFCRNRKMIFAGVTHVDEALLKKYPMMKGFTCFPDIKTNLELVQKMSPRRALGVELDYTYNDSLIRRALYKAADELGFYNDDKCNRSMTLDRTYNGKILPVNSWMLFPLSEMNRDRNCPPEHAEWQMKVIQGYYNEAAHSSHLQVHFNANSNSLIDRSESPQFTAIRQTFGDPGIVRYLCGYFASHETVIRDAVDYASQVLRGADIKSLEVKEHEKGYYMDYNAMKALRMDVGDWDDKFTIVNKPDYTMIILKFLGGGLLVALVFGAITWYVESNRRKKKQRVADELREKQSQLTMALGENTLMVWHCEHRKKMYFLTLGTSMSYRGYLLRIHHEFRRGFENLFEMKEENGNYVFQMKVRRDDSSQYRWLELRYNLDDSNRKTRSLSGVCFYIDDIKALEAQMLQIQAQKLEIDVKEDVMANMTHDIRTPLGAIVGFADLMNRQLEDTTIEERHEYAEYILQNSEMLQKMLSDIMENRASAGHFRFHKEKVVVSQLVHDIYATNSVLCPQHLAFIEKQDEDKALTLVLDRHRICEVINNFISNAFKFTPVGSITLGWNVLASEQSVEIYVEDTGIGISEVDMAKLGDRFYKTDEGHKGTGLGLNICNAIMQQHGGELQMTSKLGEGSRFSAVLPLEEKGGRQ